MTTMSVEAFKAFKDALGLPPRTVSFKMNAPLNGTVSIECEYRPSIDLADLTVALKRFSLKEIVDDDQVGGGSKV